MKILPNLLLDDSDRAKLHLHGGIKEFLVQSNEPKSALKSTVRSSSNTPTSHVNSLKMSSLKGLR